MTEDGARVLFALGMLGAALAFVIGITVFDASMEARTFRKLTGREDVTWFDALWVELRVDCNQ